MTVLVYTMIFSALP